MKYRYALVLLLRNRSRCLVIVLDTIPFNKIKYARKSIYHVFLVWMGKSNPGLRAATTCTYNPIQPPAWQRRTTLFDIQIQ